MARRLNNVLSVQAQLSEIKALQLRVEVLIGELKSYMDNNDCDCLYGLTDYYSRVWVNRTKIFDSNEFKKDYPELFEEYKRKEKSGGYRYSVKEIK